MKTKDTESSQIGASTYVITTCGLADYETMNKHKANTASRKFQACKCQEIGSETDCFETCLNM